MLPAIRKSFSLVVLVFVLAHPLSSLAAPPPNLALCLSNYTSQLVDLLLSNQHSGALSVANITHKVHSYLSQYTYNCLGVSVARQIKVLVPTLPNLISLVKNALAFEAATGIRVLFETVDNNQINAEMLLEMASSPIRDGWIFDPSITGAMADQGGFADLGPFVGNTTRNDLQWADILKFFREVSAVYGQRIIGIPMDGNILFLYYRADLLARYKIPVPETWDDMLDVVRRLNGSDTDGDGKPDLTGACFDVLDGCRGQYLLAAVAASYIQYLGTSHGFWFDPDTAPILQPLVNNPGMAAALAFWQEMMLYTPKRQTCNAVNTDFINGNCLFTINWANDIKSLRGFPAGLPGRTRVAPLPGSTLVLDRAKNVLVPCTQQLCPYAHPYTNPRTGEQGWVNTAPYPAFGGWTGGVSSRVAPEQQQAMFDFLAFIVSPEISWKDVTERLSTVDAFRRQHVEDIDKWVSAGYDRELMTNYLGTIKASLDHPNVMLDSRLAYDPSGVGYRQILNKAFINATKYANRVSIPEIMTALEAYYNTSVAQAVIKFSHGNPLRFAQQYWNIIGRTDSIYDFVSRNLGPSIITASITGGPSSPEDRTQILVPAIAVPIATVLLLAGLAAYVYLRHKQDKFHSLFGKLLPPGVGPNTTLVITDVQDSTALFELLPVHVMDQVMQIHCNIIRQMVHDFNGYESATEGDSFIIAFHTANDAVSFCVRLQEELLEAEWPSELLSQESCISVQVVRVVLSPTAAECSEIVLGSWRKQTAMSRLPRSIRKSFEVGNRASGTHSSSRKLVESDLDPGFSSDDMYLSHHTIGSEVDLSADSPPSFVKLSTQRSHLAHVNSSISAASLAERSRFSDGGFYPVESQAPDFDLAANRFSLQPMRQISKTTKRVEARRTTLEPTRPLGSSELLRHVIRRAWNVDIAAAQPKPAEGETTLLVLRGLRVRCGVHSGATVPSDISYNQAAGRMQYSGSFLAATKLIEGCTHGGQVLMSQSTFSMLDRSTMPPGVALLHLGEHIVSQSSFEVGAPGTEQDGCHLYTSLLAKFTPRLVLLGAPRTLQSLSCGVLDAPIGTVTIGFMHMVGADTLKAWDVYEAAQAVSVFSTILKQQLYNIRGYLVEHVDGFVLVAISNAMAALKFVLEVQKELMAADWSRALLKHALAEEVSVTQVNRQGERRMVVILRGPRLKVGLDTGETRSEVHGSTGRIAYRGKTVNRAARIGARATSGQVLCSADTWAAAATSMLCPPTVSDICGVTCIKLAEVQAKGIKEKIQICQVMPADSHAVPCHASQS